MLYLACASCGQPRSIAEVHAWIADAAYCSAACRERATADGTAPALPDEREALTAARTALSRSLETVARAGRVVFDDGSSTGDAALAGLLLGGLIGGLAVSAIADANATAQRDRAYDALHAVEQAIEDVVRRLMVLHALELPIAAAMRPLVMTHSPVGATHSALRALHAELTRLAHGLDVWIAELESDSSLG